MNFKLGDFIQYDGDNANNVYRVVGITQVPINDTRYNLEVIIENEDIIGVGFIYRNQILCNRWEIFSKPHKGHPITQIFK